MKRAAMILVCGMVLGALAVGGDEHGPETLVVRHVRGKVLVRHGVSEDWTPVKSGERLKPDDTMKTGADGSATVVAPAGNAATKDVALPSEVIVDLSDVRDLTPEELMLKLTMEKVRSSSYHWKTNEMHFSTSTIVHGTDKSPETSLAMEDTMEGQFELNGSKVLYENGFFSTCALRTMDILRRYPPLGEKVETRLMVAEALDKARLRGEAINEYTSILAMETLGVDQKEMVKKRIELLRNRE